MLFFLWIFITAFSWHLYLSFSVSLFPSPVLISCPAAKRKMWKLKSFGSLRNINKTGNKWGRWSWNSLCCDLHTISSLCLFPSSVCLTSHARLVHLTCVYCNNPNTFVFSPSIKLLFCVVLHLFVFCTSFTDYGFITAIILTNTVNELSLYKSYWSFHFYLQMKRMLTLS